MYSTIPCYKGSLSLLTDLYQLTMAYAWWKQGVEDVEAVFHLYFRRNPFRGGYTVACGVGQVVDFLERFSFSADDLEFLASLTRRDGAPLFEDEFLEHLSSMSLTCDVEAVPEGTVVFPYEPLVRVSGPIDQCVLLETPLLNMINFQSLIATKASRVCRAAGGKPVLEFGLRRAQGIDGALSASRAAYVGGCAGTSNVLAARLFGIPVRGTHAHSWVMSFESEREAFERFAEVFGPESVFLVDTYDSVEGARNAAAAAGKAGGMIGVRLDSGDLALLSRKVREVLDEEGFREARIFASNDLDEFVMESLHMQGAEIDVWGVGTRLVTAYDQPALGGVYKLSAIRRGDGEWTDRMKISDEAAKVSIPGLLQVRRFSEGGRFLCDVIYDERNVPQGVWESVDPRDHTDRRRIPIQAEGEELLRPLMRRGRLVGGRETLETARERLRLQLESLGEDVLRLMNPGRYHVGLELGLHERRTRLILEARRKGVCS